jgi:DNA-binding MarR family transcriptional regulator
MSSPSRRLPPPRVGALLRLAWEEAQAEIQAGVHAAGFEDLRPSHRALLRYPAIDGLRPTQLAFRHGLSKQAINDLLRELEALGYITLEADPDDRRARIVRFTDRGWDIYQTMSRISLATGRRWAKIVGKERFAEFEATLRDILEAERGRLPGTPP